MYSSPIYKHAPAFIQSALISSRAWLRKVLRERGRFASFLARIEKTQWLTSPELTSECDASLQAILTHAISHVPHYQNLGIALSRFGGSPQAVIEAFPFLDKATVRDAGNTFIANTRCRFLFKGGTSGTTGSPLTLYQDLQAINRENAFIWRQMIWAGYTPGARRAWLRGDLVVPANQTAPPFWRANLAENMLMFSPCHLSEQNAHLYLDALAGFDPVIIQAYPSSISFLAAWLESVGKTYEGSSLKGIVTSSETLEESSRKVIEQRFGCRVFDWYGQTERVAAIGTCEHGNYHVISDYSHVELIPGDDGLHEIVGTGFNNYAMPLIRYRTGDFVELDKENECLCGRAFPLIKRIVGRGGDFIKLSDGRLIGPLNNILKGIEGILEAQFVQEAHDVIAIRVVPSELFSAVAQQNLQNNIRDRFGSQISVRIVLVQQIERTSRGKLQTVISQP
jgi:phenylacetate-CoA ligase